MQHRQNARVAELHGRTNMKKTIPLTATDSQLHFIVTSYKQGLVTKDEANRAIKKLLKERITKHGSRYQF